MTITITLPARARAQLIASTIHVVRGGRKVLSNVDLTITPGTRVGIVGENGRGKSTLLHILAEILAPDSGVVQRIGTLGIAEQEMPADDGLTVGDLITEQLADSRAALRAFDLGAEALAAQSPGAEKIFSEALNAAETLDAWDADRRVDVALESLGTVTERTKLLSELSVGQRYRVRLACLLGAEHDFLLLDEPTNHLDQQGLDYLTEKLRGSQGGIVVVSHDRAFLTDVATHILDLDPSRDGIPRLYGGGYPGYKEGRAAERERWVDEYEQQRAEHSRLTQDLATAQNRLVSGWRPPKGTGKHQRQTRAPGLVRSVHRRRDDLENHRITAPEPPLEFRMPELSARPGVTLIQAVEVAVDGRMPSATTLILESGSKVVVSGPNGAGKSTFLSMLAGTLAPSTGEIHHARGARIAYLSQESPTPTTQRARDAFNAHLGTLASAGTLKEGEIISLKSLGILSSADLNRPVRELSMGQQRRLDLAMALATKPHVLLLDEPSNHLSISLVDELTEGLHATNAAVIVATHDRQLRRDLASWQHINLANPTEEWSGSSTFEGRAK
ncbi:ABC-F family ATP-binding cassette domain-containing protein [Glutamicibacter protophormiae]